MRKRNVTCDQLRLINTNGYLNSYSHQAKKEIIKTCFFYFYWDFVTTDPNNTIKLLKYDIEKNERIDSRCERLANGWRAYTTIDDEYLDLILDIIKYDIKDDEYFAYVYKKYFR